MLATSGYEQAIQEPFLLEAVDPNISRHGQVTVSKRGNILVALAPEAVSEACRFESFVQSEAFVPFMREAQLDGRPSLTCRYIERI